MARDHVLTRIGLVASAAVLGLALAGCYKDAGDNVQPTSYRVDLSDLTLTATPDIEATVTALATAEPSGPTPTRTLVPTTTPAGAVEPTNDIVVVEEAEATDAPVTVATYTPLPLPATFTPAVALPTEVESMIVTPGLSDIQPSNTPRPTIDPTLMPTPTPIPAEENPCIHVVQPNDTLYGISRDAEVTVEELVSENWDVLGGQSTYLQIGWELRLPGCAVEGEEAEAETAAPPVGAATSAPETAPTAAPTVQSGPTVHTVQPGETIFAIARQYGVSPQAIIDANTLINPNRINPGDQLTIPAP